MTVQKRTIIWVVLAGLAASLAVLTRPTSLAMLPAIAAAFILSGQKHRLLPFGLAFAAPLIAEGLCYWIAAGDPFLSWRLSLAHTTIPTDQLAAGVNLAEKPFFNVRFIDNWRPASGIEVHWTVDAFLNLVANGAVMVLPVAIALLVLHRRRLGQPEAGGRALLFLVGAAAFYFATLVFGLAIDPKPRMFLPVAAIACVACGVLGALSLKKGHWVPVFGIAMLIGVHAAISAVARVGGDPFRAAFAPLIM
jgi:4-amino-4-deoxy-L-arabinose transferase-like glycosyltransferase